MAPEAKANGQGITGFQQLRKMHSCRQELRLRPSPTSGSWVGTANCVSVTLFSTRRIFYVTQMQVITGRLDPESGHPNSGRFGLGLHGRPTVAGRMEINCFAYGCF